MFILGTARDCSGVELEETVVVVPVDAADDAAEIEIEAADDPDGDLCRRCLCWC